MKHRLTANRGVIFHDKIGEMREMCACWCSTAERLEQARSMSVHQGQKQSKQRLRQDLMGFLPQTEISDDKQDGPRNFLILLASLVNCWPLWNQNYAAALTQAKSSRVRVMQAEGWESAVMKRLQQPCSPQSASGIQSMHCSITLLSITVYFDCWGERHISAGH